MAVHDAIRRAVDGRRIAREDQAAAIVRMAGEIEQRAAADRQPVPPDVMHTIETTGAARGDNEG